MCEYVCASAVVHEEKMCLEYTICVTKQKKMLNERLTFNFDNLEN